MSGESHQENKYDFNRALVLKRLEEIGAPALDPEVINRLTELEETPFNYDSFIIKSLAIYVARAVGESESKLALTEEQLHDLALACFLHDIGKAGPPDASKSVRETIMRVYTMHRIKGEAQELKVDSNALVEDVVRKEWPQDANQMLNDLEGLEVDGKKIKTMRDFWNAHGYWSYEMLQRYPTGINQRVLEIVASHHILEGVNPLGLKKPPMESLTIEAAELYIRFLLIVVDKYEAARVRGQHSHQGAMKMIKQQTAKSGFNGDTYVNVVWKAFDKEAERFGSILAPRI